MALRIVFLFIGAFICLVLPALAALVMIIRHKGKWYMFALGIVSFTVSQLLLRIPILNEMQNAVWFNMFVITQTFLYYMLLALSAGVFEETGRYAALRFIKKGLLTWENGVLFGLGHGGVEAFWIAGLPHVTAITNAFSGKYDAAILAAPPFDFLLGGAERILAVLLHIGFTMLVLYAIKRKKIWYFIIAVLAHGLVDAIIPILGKIGVNLDAWMTEGVLAVLAAAAVIIIVKMRAALSPAPENGGI
jgi:uncharacterized membrane protein YhfC